MSLYGDYIAEREGKAIIEREYGFATYYINGPECYIADVFIAKDHRGKGLSVKLGIEIEDIAREKGCKFISFSIHPGSMGAEHSVLILLKEGFRFVGNRGDLTFLSRPIREINNG